VNQALMNLGQELEKPKVEKREVRIQKAGMMDRQQRGEQEICDVKHEGELLRQASDGKQESQERETRVVAEVRRVVRQLAGQLEDLGTENGHDRLAVGEVA
jgi:hypothetical protein